jgi:hypothetical protein
MMDLFHNLVHYKAYIQPYKDHVVHDAPLVDDDHYDPYRDILHISTYHKVRMLVIQLHIHLDYMDYILPNNDEQLVLHDDVDEDVHYFLLHHSTSYHVE